MKLLIVSATAMEIAPFTTTTLPGMPQHGVLAVDVLIAGVGPIATAYALTRQLQHHRYDMVIQVGIGGSYDPTIALGSVVFISADRYGDLGAEDQDQYLDIFDMGLIASDEYPHKHGWLCTPITALHAGIGLPAATAITVSTVSGSQRTIAMRHSRYGAQVESMEGAALHYVCLQEGVAFAQVRAISNYVTPRDRSQWQMKAAVTSLNDWLTGYIRTLGATAAP